VACPEDEWLSILNDIPQWVPPARPMVVIAPHPDDETLGAGGLIALERRRRVPVQVVAVTDGEAAYSDAVRLGDIRREEQELALGELGVATSNIVRLAIPDGRVADFEEELIDSIRPFIRPGMLLVAPWSQDPHPDHEACGRAAERLAKLFDVSLVSYVFWAWHRATSVESLTALPIYRLELGSTVQAARAAALSRHRSQLEWETGPPILPDTLLQPAQRPFETFIIHDDRYS
jgi:LmbE family N-acetylglucosaminyl deacetylase